MRITRSNTILYCEHWAATVAFYRDVIRLDATFENEWWVEFGVTDGSFLSVADASRATITPGRGSGITISWQVDDVETARDELIGHGVAVGPMRRSWGSPAVFLHDPDGHRVELWQRPTD